MLKQVADIDGLTREMGRYPGIDLLLVLVYRLSPEYDSYLARH